MWSIFSYAYFPSAYLFGKYFSAKVFGPFLIKLFFFLMLSFNSYFCILDKRLYQMCLQIFSLSLLLVFSFFDVIFPITVKVFIFMNSSLSVLPLVDCASGTVSKESSLYLMSSSFSPLSSSRSFTVFHFTFRPMILLSYLGEWWKANIFLLLLLSC